MKHPDPASVLATLLQSKGSSLALALGRAPAEVSSEAVDHDASPGRRSLPPALRESLVVAGGVVELVGQPGLGALSLALSCASVVLAQRRSTSTAAAWLCVIDPGRSLFAPAVAGLGIPLERLLVVTPPLKSLARTSVRVLKTGVFCAVVVDATALHDLDGLPVRRFTLAAEASASTVFLLTHEDARRRQPLPTAVRARLHPAAAGVDVDIERHRHGRRGSLPWQRPLSPVELFFSEPRP